MHRLEPFLHTIDNLNEWTGRFVSLLIYVIVGLQLLDITGRNVLHISLVWVPDYAIFFFGFLILAGGYTFLHKQHVGLDILSERWSERTKAIVDLFSSFFFFLFCGVMLWKGTEIAYESVKALETSRFSYGPPVYIIKTVVPLAALLILLQGLAKFIRDLNTALSGKGKA